MGQNFTRNLLVMSDFSQPSYWLTNERLKILTFLLFDLQTSIRGQKGVEFYQESTVIANERLKILIFLLFDLKTSGRGQNGVEFNQESTGHALLLANERLNFARNPMIVVPDMCQISFYTCREWGLTNGYGHLSFYCFSAINIGIGAIPLSYNMYI